MRGDKSFENAAALLPRGIREAFLSLGAAEMEQAEEFRLRSGSRPAVLLPEGERELGTREVTPEDLASLIETATHGSAHTALALVRAGYVPLAGGCRLGLCGEMTAGADGELALRRLSSAAVRIARERRCCGDALRRALFSGGFRDTLIVSPPGAGKTTLLREMVRLLSESGERVAVADERGEIAAVSGGRAHFDVGPRTDVMTGAPKADAALMLIRSMNPTVLAMDEITSAGDVEAVMGAAGCGVRLIATAHGGSVGSLRRRGLYRRLLDEGIFARFVSVRRRADGIREYEVKELDGL